ncbi:MAG: hypothetical protein E7613_10135, partial [Ruminococcaceae bacterium]|nr:hypothetical protein [Oscillospiraceae bacterium]
MSENNTMIFTLTFDLAGGSGEFYAVTGEASSYYQLPANAPSRPGYGFMGWKNSANITFQPGGDYYFSYGNDTLTAVWEPIERTLTFNLAGGTGEFNAITGLEGESIYLGNMPIREGYYFSRWVNSVGESFCPGDTYTFNYGNDTLTAVWGSTVTFDLNGGEGNFPDISGEVMTSLMLPSEIPTKAGYNFVKWVSDKHGDNYLEYGYFIDGNDTFTAVWEIAWYTLTYNLSDADTPESIESQEGQAETNIILSDIVPTKEGFTFVRWENTAGEKFQPGAPYFFGYHDDTLTPVWGYTVTLDFSDGRTEVVKGGVGETLDFIPTSEYGTFYSWINKNSQEFLPGEYTFIHGDDYLSAMWGYTVSYDTNGGVGEFSPQTTLFGGTITIPTVTPTKDGYEFREWISTAGESFYPGATYDKNEPTILTADWMCNLYFDTDGGDEGSYLISALSEGEVFELPTPTRSNYTFVKWVNSQGVEFYPEDEYRLIYGHDTLTAVWGYTVTLDASGGECVESVIKPVGEALDIVPEYEGYNFSHWINKNGDRFDSSNPYTFEYGDDTLTAHWKYEVICLNEDGSVFDRLSADKDSNITLSTEIPTLFNHVFLHWLVQGTNNVFMPGKEFNLNRNATLVPQWRKMYILTFFDCDGDHFRIEDKYEGVDIEIQDEAPWCSGQDFVCWKIRFGNEYYFIGDIYKKDTDTGFEPIMIAEGRAAVVFDLAGGEGDISPIDFIPNEESFTVPSEIPVRLGYHFLFWTEKGVTDENENIVKYYPNATYDTVTETKRLTAVWERDKHGAYEAHNVGNKVQECVNLKTGNLTLDINDVEWQGNRLPVSVSHHYDGAFAGYKYTSGVADVNCADFSAMNCGLGFRLNLMQSMKEASVLHPDGTVSQYVFTDGNGDETYFVPFENGESVEYREKDGANITYEPSTRTMKWDNDEYIFDTSGRLVTYIDEYENSLNYHYSMGRLTAVVDGVGRIFTLNYQGGNLISVTAPDGTSVRYEYSGELLTKIIYPDNSYLLFTYASSNRISKVTMFANGDAAVIAKTYQYSNKRVSFIREYDSLNDDGKIYYYVYNEAGNTTTVSIISRDDREDDYTSEAFDTVYVFNPDGSISGQHMSVLDENGDEVLPKRTLLSVSEDMVARTENSTVNLLANHTGSFGNTDGIASGWTLYNGCTSAEFIEDESKTKYSTKYLEIKSSADGYIGQQYILAPGSYTFSAYVRLIAPSAQDNSGIALKVLDSNGNTVSSTEYIDRNDGVYTRLATSFDITETSTMNLCICLRGITEAYVNAHQLEKNTTATAYNMLENPSFEFYSGGTILSWSRISYASRATANHFDGASSLKAQSAESTVRYAYQDVKVKTSPSTRETFTLSGWCKATSYRKENEDSLCRLRAEIYYNDGTEPEEYTADFQPNVADWQYTEVTFSKSRFAEVSKVRVWCELGNTTGIAYFDAISLTREYLETGLTREDFEGYEVNANTTNSEETESEDTFSEAVDIYGNRVTETDISEEGTIYRSF